MSLRQEPLREGKSTKKGPESKKKSAVTQAQKAKLAKQIRDNQRLSRNDLRKIHDKRSAHAKLIDNSKRAKLAPSLKKWKDNPEKYDVSGVDYPIEWRSKAEREQIKMIRDAMSDLDERAATGDPIQISNRDDYKKRLELLKWQQKNPFIAAGIDTGPDSLDEGKQNYERALKSKMDYGFDLTNPEKSFLHNFHLKKHDLKGLRIFIERDNKHNPGARAWYNEVTFYFHLPPEPKRTRFDSPKDVEERKQYTRKSILHEIAHHIQSKNLHEGNEHYSYWGGFSYAYRMPDGYGKFKIVKESPQDVIYQYQKYFGTTLYFKPRYGAWFGYKTTKKLLEKSDLATDQRRNREFWAETFAHYRLGNLSREVKWKRTQIDMFDDAIKFESKKLKSYTGKKNTKEYRELKKTIRQLERKKKIATIHYSNIRKFEKMMKRWDRSGWNPKYEEEEESKRMLEWIKEKQVENK